MEKKVYKVKAVKVVRANTARSVEKKGGLIKEIKQKYVIALRIGGDTITLADALKASTIEAEGLVADILQNAIKAVSEGERVAKLLCAPLKVEQSILEEKAAEEKAVEAAKAKRDAEKKAAKEATDKANEEREEKQAVATETAKEDEIKCFAECQLKKGVPLQVLLLSVAAAYRDAEKAAK